MRNTIIFLTIICFTLTMNADLYAQDSLRVSKLAQIYDYWYDTRDVAIQGNYAYVMTNLSGLRILDISDPEQPEEVGYINTGGWGRSVVANENTVYFLNVYAYFRARGGYNPGLYIVDVTDPTSPKVASYYNLSRGATALVYQNGFLYIEDGVDYDPGQGYINRTTLILDVSDSFDPFEAGRLVQEEGYPSYDIAVSGDFLYKARVTDGIEIVDVADSENPEFLFGFEPGGQARGLTAVDDYLYLADGRDGFRIFDVSNPRQAISETGSIDGMEYAVDVAVSGDYAYVADTDNDALGGWVRVVDIESPDNPDIIGSVSMHYPARISVSGNYAYVATSPTLEGLFGTSDGLQIFDISEPDNPVNIGEYDSDGAIHKVTLAGDYAYLSDDSLGMRIVDISDPAHPEEIGSYDTPGATRNVFLLDTLAYIADGGSGLRIVDVSDPVEPEEISFIEVEGFCTDVKVADGFAYVTTGLPYREPFEQVISGMYAIDVSDPSSPELMGFYDAFRSVNSIALSGNYAFLTVFSWGLVILDISNPENIEEVAFLEEEDGANNSIFISGNYAYIADSQVFGIIDISDPTNPEWVSVWRAYWSCDVFVQGDYAFIADHEEGLKILNISDPFDPYLAGSYDTPGLAWGVAVDGDKAYVADVTNLGVYDCSEVVSVNDKIKPIPQDFRLLVAYPNPFNSTTTISYGLQHPGHISLNIYSPWGQNIITLFEGYRQSGFYSTILDANDLPSGLYFVRLEAAGQQVTRKAMLIR